MGPQFWELLTYHQYVRQVGRNIASDGGLYYGKEADSILRGGP